MSKGNGATPRDATLDMTRGLIMVLMALDHTRMFLTAAQFDPVAIEQTNFAYFLTRWITHLCAPGFFFVAGLSVALAERNGLSGTRSTAWLLSRGLWLIALEATIIGVAWSFTPGWSWFGVIWSLGASMVCLAALRWLPRSVLASVALAVLLLHNNLPIAVWLGNGSLSALLYETGWVQTIFGPKLSLFPILPWLAVMALGYASSNWLTPNEKLSPLRSLVVGASLLAIFAMFRLAGFGEPLEGGFNQYADTTQTAMSFLNVEKYPPSLQFVLITLGALLVLAAALPRLRLIPFLANSLLSFGRAPLFFYVLHLWVIHLLALACAIFLDWPTSYLIWQTPSPNLTPPEGYGFPLWGVFLAWLVVLFVLYPLCLRFEIFKHGPYAPRWTKFL